MGHLQFINLCFSQPHSLFQSRNFLCHINPPSDPRIMKLNFLIQLKIPSSQRKRLRYQRYTNRRIENFEIKISQQLLKGLPLLYCIFTKRIIFRRRAQQPLLRSTLPIFEKTEPK
jgi:hypothetical protein